MLAVPTLAGSIGYAMGEAFKWRTGLDHKPYRARRFYAVIAAATVIGTALNFIGVAPIKALIWSAVINGLISAPLLCALMLIAQNHAIMGKFVIPNKLFIAGWLTTGLMTAAAILTVVHLLASST